MLCAVCFVRATRQCAAHKTPNGALRAPLPIASLFSFIRVMSFSSSRKAPREEKNCYSRDSTPAPGTPRHRHPLDHQGPTIKIFTKLEMSGKSAKTRKSFRYEGLTVWQIEPARSLYYGKEMSFLDSCEILPNIPLIQLMATFYRCVLPLKRNLTNSLLSLYLSFCTGEAWQNKLWRGKI